MLTNSASAPHAPPPLALWLVLSIAALAGFVDAVSYAQFKGLFVSFMSGNTTALGVAVAKANAAKASELLQVLGWFVGGVVGGTLLHNAAGPRPAPVVLGVVAALLALARLWPPLAEGGLTLAMGVLNASVHQMGGVKVSLTFFTGALVKFGTGLADWLSGRQASWEWLWQLPLWSGFLGGAMLGADAEVHLDLNALWVAAGLSTVLALAARLVPSID